MKKTLTLLAALLLSLNINAANISGKVEVVSFEVRDADGILIDSDYLYYDSFIIRDSILIGINGLGMEFKFGKLKCSKTRCVGGPFYNDADMPEVIEANIQLNSSKEGFIQVDWDESQSYKVQFSQI